MNPGKVLKALRNPRKAAVKAARKVRKLRRFLGENVRLRLGLGEFDRGRAEAFLDLGGKPFRDWFRAKACPLWDDASLSALRAGCPEAERSVILDTAARIRAHEFDYLGSGPVRVGTGAARDGYEGIDWYLDYRHGSRWPAGQHHKFVKVVKGDGSDIKYLWELSRFHQLLTLGQAFVLTGEDAFAREYRLQALDWLAANPTDSGPNWQCCMEVGIRAANLALSLFLVKASPEIDGDFARKVMVSLWRHCDHIVHNLEYSDDLTSNHYLSNIAGLSIVACLFPELKGAAAWSAFARREMESEMGKQVFPDGTDFEASTAYHRLVLELFFYPALIARESGRPFSGSYLASLERMFRVAHALVKHDGRINPVGDDDSGRFLRFFPGPDPLKHAYLLSLGAAFFGKPALVLREIADESESRWALPRASVAAPEVLGSLGVPLSAAFPDSGWYLHRDRSTHVQIACGPNGQKENGGHGHNDKLSFCLQWRGEDILIDPGTYVYTSDAEARNRFRSTAWHTTARVDGREQNPFVPGLYFVLPDRARAKALRWEAGPDGFRFEGSHQGYAPIIHRRELAYSAADRTLRIRDRFQGISGPGRFEFFFQLGPAVTSTIAEGRSVRLASGRASLRLECGEAAGVWSVLEGSHAPGYGQLRENRRLAFTADRNADFEVEFRLSLPAE